MADVTSAELLEVLEAAFCCDDDCDEEYCEVEVVVCTADVTTCAVLLDELWDAEDCAEIQSRYWAAQSAWLANSRL